MFTKLPTFSERVKNSVVSKLKRNTSFNLKIKANSKRHAVIELQNEPNFDSGKLIKVAEMRTKSIGIELYKTLKNLIQYKRTLKNKNMLLCCWGGYPYHYRTISLKKELKKYLVRIIITEKDIKMFCNLILDLFQ